MAQPKKPAEPTSTPPPPTQPKQNTSIVGSVDEVQNSALQEAYRKTRTPDYNYKPGAQRSRYARTVKNPLANRLRFGPTQQVVSEEFLRNPITKQVLARKGAEAYRMPEGMRDVEDVTFTPPGRGFWEDPQRIAAYRNVMQSMPPDWTPPPGIDRAQLEQAYQYMSFRQGDRNWWEWGNLPDDDPATPWLRSIEPPTDSFILPADKQAALEHRVRQTQLQQEMQTRMQQTRMQQAQQANFAGGATWEELEPWQQTMMLFFPQSDVANRPELNKIGAAVAQSAMSAGIAGGLITPLFGPVAGGLTFAGLTALGAYGAYTGTELPIYQEVMEGLDWLAIQAKRGYGVVLQAQENGLDEIIADLPTAWQAGLLSYQSAEMDWINALGPAVSAGWDATAAIGLTEAGGWDRAASPTEVWKFHQGFVDPQQIAPNQWGEVVRGGAALEEVRKRIHAGEDIDQIIADFEHRYGSTGTLNDFMMEMLLDPANALPFAMGKAGGKIADLSGHKRLAQHFADVQGSLLVDITPFPLQGLVSMVTGKAGSPGLLETLQSYKYSIVQRGLHEAGSAIPDASALSAFDKRVGGLTKEGRIAELEQRPQHTNPIAKAVDWLFTLTDSARAQAMVAIYQDNLANLLTLDNADPVVMTRLAEQAGAIQPTEAGAIGEQILKAPTTATVQQGYSEALKDGIHQKMLAQWISTETQRKVLGQLATALQESNQGTIIEQLATDPDALARRINALPDIPPAMRGIDGKALKAFFKPYLGTNPVAWHADAYRAQLHAVISDRMDAWIARRYNLKPDHAVFRISQALKGMQSLLLLGINPTYFINNAVNNAVTRAAVGVTGYMTPRQISAFMDRFGLVPHRLNEGLGPAGDAKSQRTAINAALDAGDTIDKAQRVIDNVNQKLGLFSRFSAMNERMESRQAYTVGIMRFMSKQWKRGKGMRRMSAATEAMLDAQAPGIKEAIYAAAEAGLNLREVEEKLLGDFIQPQIRETIEQAAAKVFPGNADVVRMLIEETGILDALEKELAEAKNPEQVEEAFNRVSETVGNMVDELSSRELVHRAEEVSNAVQSEGFPAALSLFTDVQVRIAIRWLRHTADLQDLFNRRATMTPEAFDIAYRAHTDADSRSWKRINDFEEQTMAGILKAVGLNTPGAQEFSQLMVDAHKNTRKFFDGWDEKLADGTVVHHDGRNDKYKKFFAEHRGKRKGESYDQSQKRWATAWNRLQAEINLDYQTMATEENRLQAAMNEKFAQAFAEMTGRPAEEAMSWREQVMVIRMQMQEEMTAFRQMIDDARLNAEQRNAAWSQFIQRYNRMIAEMKGLEVEGAFTLAGQPGAPAAQAAVDQINQAVPQPAQPAAAPTQDEATINAAMAAAEGRESVNPDAQARLQRAAEAGLTEKNGSPIHPAHLVNIINEHQRTQENGKTYTAEDLPAIPLEELDAAIRFNKIKHGHERAQSAAELAIAVDDILSQADATKREAEMHAAGLLTRRTLRERWKEFGVEPEAIDVAMQLIDQHAERLARMNGEPVTSTTVDRWVATHIKDIVSSQQRKGLHQDDAAWYFSQLQRTLETMPNRMTAEALEGFLKGKAKADELRWTGFDEWLAEKKAAGEQVTKAEAVAFVRANRIRIKEVMLGGETQGNLHDVPGYSDAARRLREAGVAIEINEDDPEIMVFRLEDEYGQEEWLTVDEMQDGDLADAATFVEQANRAFYRGATFAVDPEFMKLSDELKQLGVQAITAMDAPEIFQPGESWEGRKISFSPINEMIEGDSWGDDEVTGANRTYMLDQIPHEAAWRVRRLAIIARDYQVTSPARPTKFFGYTDKMGKNYRELLLEWDRPQDELIAWDYYENTVRRENPNLPEWEDLSEEDRYDHQYMASKERGLPHFTYDPHWGDEVNVLAHVRFDDRTNAAGEKILFIEEIQSDWHEQGRERGYRGDITELNKLRARRAELELAHDQRVRERSKTIALFASEAADLVIERTGLREIGPQAIRHARALDTDFSDRWDAFMGEAEIKAINVQLDALTHQINQAEANLGYLPPQAPFKNTWPELVIKRMIRYAAENGYDRVAWANGKENADRYNLSTYIDELVWEKRGDYTYLVGNKKNGQKVFGQQISNAELAENVGKEVAQQITGSEETRGTISGEGLAVGGQGMRTFYDQMIPSLVGKYIKKWGSQVEMTDYGAPTQYVPAGESTAPMPGMYTMEQDPEGRGWAVYDWDNDIIDVFTTEQEASAMMRQLTWHDNPNEFAIVAGTREDLANGLLPDYWNLEENDARNTAGVGDEIIPMSELIAITRQDSETEQAEPLPPAQRMSFKVTPDMRKQAMQGQSLFQKNKPQSRAEELDMQDRHEATFKRPGFQPGRTDTNTKEFADWFGRSQMTNPETDAPLVLYHAGGAVFDTFRDTNQVGEVGIHFGTLEQAEARAAAKGLNQATTQLYPVYLRLENPIILNFDPGVWTAETWRSIAKRIGNYMLASKIDEAISRGRQWYTAQRERMQNPTGSAIDELTTQRDRMVYDVVVAALQDAGYDGVAYPNEVEGEGHSFAVFDPGQIKSVYNAGTWSANSKNIFLQRGMKIEEQVQRVRDMGWIDPASIAAVFEGGTPRHLQSVISFIMEQRQKFTNGEMTPRDVAKAYLLTLSSIGSKEKHFATVQRAFQEHGLHFIRDGYPIALEDYAYRDARGEWMIRPEELAAAWIMTDEGQAALNALERGEISPAWQAFITARQAAFGRFGTEGAAKTDWFLKPGQAKKNLNDLVDITRRINQAMGDPDQVSAIVQELGGIAGGKSGFVKHLLGFGDETTVDAQEINFWTDRLQDHDDVDFIRSRGREKHITPEIKKKIQQAFYALREQGIGGDIPEEAFIHTMHHWLWDAQKKTETTHYGMYTAMRLGTGGKVEPGTRAAVDFIEDGRAIISAINAPNISSMVHELGHVFRKDLPEKDLDTIAKWGGLKGASELRTLEARWLAGELREGDPDYQRYVDAEEKFARGWERYLAEGDAPTPALRSIFQKFTNWLRGIYQSLKRTAGRVVGFEQQPEFAEYGGANIHERIGGMTIRDIFDRQLADEAQRPKTFEQLVGEAVEKLKKEPGHSRHTAKELATRAKKQVVLGLMRYVKDQAEADAMADNKDQFDEVPNVDLGAVHPTAFYDAAEEIRSNPALAPWNNQISQPVAEEQASKISKEEQQLISGNLASLPQPVQRAVREYAQLMLEQMTGGRMVRGYNANEETGDGVKVNEYVGAKWYRDLRASVGKPGGFHAKVKTALKNITTGQRITHQETHQIVMQELVSQLTGEAPSDSGLGYDAALLWYLKRTGTLFEKFGEQFDTATQEWLDKNFGKDADKAMNEYLLWAMEQEEGQADQVAEVEPLSVRIAEQQQADQVQADAYDSGEPMPLDQALELELVDAGPAPIPPEVEQARAAILKGLTGDERAYAEDLIAELESASPTSEPHVRIPPAREAAILARIEENTQTLFEYGSSLYQPTVVSQTPPGPGLQVKRTYAHPHGDYQVAAIVYLDGQPVAYLPTAEAARPFMDDGTRLLGLDPEDPDSWIVYRDGQIGSLNPETPGRVFTQQQQAEPQPRITKEVFKKRAREMTDEEQEWALTHDELTGLSNMRGYEEKPRKAVQVSLDVEGLKFINDTYGHLVGDEVLKALGIAVEQAAGEDGYRFHGDEYAMEFDTEGQAVAAVERVEFLLALQEITTGEHERYNGLGVNAGIGRTFKDADDALNTNKERAISEGRRAARGQRPVNLRQVTESPQHEAFARATEGQAQPQAEPQPQLPGAPAAPEFALQAEQAEAQQFNPQPTVPQGELFDRREQMRGIEPRQAEDLPFEDDGTPRLFQQDYEQGGFDFTPKPRENPWVTALKTRFKTTDTLQRGSAFLTPDGKFADLRDENGNWIDHDQGAELASEGEELMFDHFMRRTKTIRAAKVDDGGAKVIYFNLMARPTLEQMQAIKNSVGNQMFTVFIGAKDEHVSAFMGTKDWSRFEDFIDEAFERRRLYDRSTWKLTLSAVADFPSPLSGYTGNKRSMLQAGHYNDILTRERAQSYNRIREAFGGSGLLGNAFQVRSGVPRLLNELDSDIVGFHRQVKADAAAVQDVIRAERDRVMQLMDAYPEGGGEAAGAVLEYWRDMNWRLKNGSPAEQAARVAITNSGSTAVMGGGQKLISGASTQEGEQYVWRITRDSFDNVIDNIGRHSELLQKVEITQLDARQILAEASEHELVLLDPPYVQRGTDDERLTGYREGAELTTIQGALDFIDSDMRQAQERGVPMIYTNNAHPAIVAALEELGFHIRLVTVRSMRSERMEVVAWNDAVGPADASYKTQDTTTRRKQIGSGRIEYLQYKARQRASQPQQPAGAQAVGDVPLGGTPMPEPAGQTLDEVAAEYLSPIMRQAAHDYTAKTRERRLKFESLDQRAQENVKGWMGQMQGDLAATKYAAMAYGERMRDAALLNYSKRYGFDSMLGIIAPYQFWYTRSMWNWTKRMIDKPAWWSMYARIQNMRDDEEDETQMPSRFRGKVRIPMPFLPEWAGGGLWVDPYKSLLPMSQFGQPLERWTQDKAQIDRRAESLLQEMVEQELVTFDEAQAAIQTKTGSAWDRAVRAAEAELDKSANPATMVSQMLAPPLWWNYASNIAGGTPEKISNLPSTRLGQSLRTATKGTMAEPFGQVAGGLLAGPEEALRGVAGLDKFGEWGEYYVDRQLANMAADGEISPADARIAMIERQGPAYQAAQQRVEYELMQRTPGANTLNQLLQGSPGGVMQSLPSLFFPGGLFPDGELALRGIKPEHDKAWADYKQGDKEALDRFFTKYPEYEARLALYKEPEERMRQFLVNEVWDRYSGLERPNKSRVRQQLGDRFEQMFLNKETQSYESIPVPELAAWAKFLGGQYPKTEETAPVTELEQAGMMPEAELWGADVAQGIMAYQNQRDQAFPGIFALQETYFTLPEKSAQRKAFLRQFPKLKEYWDWKKQYEQEHPDLEPYFEESRESAAERVSQAELQQVSGYPALMYELATFGATGMPLTPGAQQLLQQIGKSAGRTVTVADYTEMLLAGLAAGQ